jgi:hypothetical protein
VNENRPSTVTKRPHRHTGEAVVFDNHDVDLIALALARLVTERWSHERRARAESRPVLRVVDGAQRS